MTGVIGVSRAVAVLASLSPVLVMAASHLLVTEGPGNDCVGDGQASPSLRGHVAVILTAGQKHGATPPAAPPGSPPAPGRPL